MSGPDPEKLMKSVNRTSAMARIEWLEDLAFRMENGGIYDTTDINGLRSLAESFRRGLK